MIGNVLRLILSVGIVYGSFLLVLLPFIVATLPFFHLAEIQIGITDIILPASQFVFLFSFLYLFFDFLFGFTLKSFIRNARPIDGNPELAGLDEICREVGAAFRAKGIRFMVKDSEEINALAISSFCRKYVILRSGLIDHISLSTKKGRRRWQPPGASSAMR